MSEQPYGEAGGAPGPRTFVERVIGAIKLDASVFEEVEHDGDAIGQAAGVVGLAGIANGLAAAGALGTGGLVAGIIGSFLGWLLWTGVVWLIGVRLFKHSSDFEELLRTLGFVFAPQILLVIGLIPFALLQAVLGLAVLVMTVVAFIRAVRQALDVDTGRAFFVSAMAVVAYLLLAVLLRGLVGGIV